MPCMSLGWKKGMTPCCPLWRKTALNAECFTRTVSETLTLSARRVWDSEVSQNSEIKPLIWSCLYTVVNTKVYFTMWGDMNLYFFWIQELVRCLTSWAAVDRTQDLQSGFPWTPLHLCPRLPTGLKVSLWMPSAWHACPKGRMAQRLVPKPRISTLWRLYNEVCILMSLSRRSDWLGS